MAAPVPDAKPETPRVLEPVSEPEFLEDTRRYKVPFHEWFAPPSKSDGIYIALDAETTGQSVCTSPSGRRQKHAMIELGAAVVRSGDLPTKVLATFEGFMKIPDDATWCATTVARFWARTPESRATKELAEACTIDPTETMTAFVLFLDRVFEDYANGDPYRITFVTDTNGFDTTWIDHYLAIYTERGNLSNFFSTYRPVLDTSSYNFGAAQTDGVYRFDVASASGRCSDEEQVRVHLQIPREIASPYAHTHRAVHDALHIGITHVIVESAVTEARHETQQRRALEATESVKGDGE